MKKCLIFLLLICLFSLSSCKNKNCNKPMSPIDIKNQYSTHRQDYYDYLDTISYVLVEYDKTKINEAEVKEDLKKVENILFNIEVEFAKEQTDWMKIKEIEKSTTMIVNENSGIAPVKVSKEYINVLKKAISISSKTSGGFDVTVGPLTSLWDIPARAEYCNLMNDQHCEIPSEEEINETLKLVNYENIIIDENENTVFLKEKGMMLDFGAIAKGYAADKVLEHLLKDAYTYISINLGGNVVVSGKTYLYNQYTTTSDIVPIGIENPYYAKFRELTVMNVNETNVTVVASGVSKRYIEVVNPETNKLETYHHIINPLTGYPYENEIETITVITQSSMEADGLSTGIFSLGLEQGIKYLQDNNLKGIFITKDYKIYIVGNIDYTLKEGVQNEYTIITK